MRTLLTCSIAAILTLTAACGNSDRLLNRSPTHRLGVHSPIIMTDDPIPGDLPADGASIENVRIVGDLIKLTVSYSGGCRRHVFKLFGSTGFMESLPVQARLFLSHDGNGDMCEALIRDELVFDLSSLKRSYKKAYSDDGPVLLRIFGPGATEPIRPLPRYEL
jgi:hypothetical protein